MTMASLTQTEVDVRHPMSGQDGPPQEMPLGRRAPVR